MWVGRLTCAPADALRARPATCGALGRASVNSDAANQGAQTHVPPFHREVPEPHDLRTQEGSVKSNATSRRKVTSAAANTKTPSKADEPKAERVTKQERVLTLLSQPEGVSIEEMMQTTDWQQHCVRGFLAGTVKRKLGFSLTSLKPNGGVRRYRIETRRGR